MTLTQEINPEPPQLDGSEWFTGRDGSENYLRFWQARSPEAYILYLHGIEGHSLWFAETAKFLAENGITTLAMDRRGSGQSKEARGDLANYKQLLADLSDVLAYVKRKAGDKPFYLMANCWGAKLAVILSQKHLPESKLIDGLILSSPALEVKVDLKFSEKLQVAWRLLTGDSTPLAIPLKTEYFTDNPVYLEYIENDKLRLEEASANFFFNTFLLTHMSKVCAEKIELPTLIVQSGTDAIVDEQGIERWFLRLASADKKLEVFKGVKHSLDFDRNPEPYRQLLLSWILEHSRKRSERSHENSLA